MGIGSWATAFGLTLLVEVPVYLLGLVGPLGWLRAAVVAVGVNALTHPLLWLTFAALSPTGGWWLVAFVIGELLVVAVEVGLVLLAVRTVGHGLDDGGRVRTVLWCLVANLASMIVGLAISLL